MSLWQIRRFASANLCPPKAASASLVFTQQALRVLAYSWSSDKRDTWLVVTPWRDEEAFVARRPKT